MISKIDNLRIILASQSPRRYDLLKMIGLEFDVIPSNIDEINHDDLPPLDYALYNAKEKAMVVAKEFPDALIISADTIVIHENHILEKPIDANHAFEILARLNGNQHQVITAFGIMHINKNISILDFQKTEVFFRKLPSKTIKEYIDTGEPMDKAGGYGAQGLGALLIERVEGCFYNVVGFPLGKFYEHYIKISDKFLITK